ncbi:MAG: Hpt domain-containing protein [Hyphomicrobium sp.]|jgi:HPt (histidine-containing phosphotransfer) domain-containing protein
MHGDSPPETGEPVDLAHLSRYTLGDRGLELEILGLFVDQLPITIAALREAETEKDWGMAAHTLKGSARAVGAWPLATIAEDAERMRGLPAAMARAAVADRLEEAACVVRDFIAALPRVS